MTGILLSIAATLGKALLTEMFFKKVVLSLLKAGVKSSKNSWDDQIVDAVDEAWHKE